jgi:hypothetical protein
MHRENRKIMMNIRQLEKEIVKAIHIELGSVPLGTLECSNAIRKDLVKFVKKCFRDYNEGIW